MGEHMVPPLWPLEGVGGRLLARQDNMSREGWCGSWGTAWRSCWACPDEESLVSSQPLLPFPSCPMSQPAGKRLGKWPCQEYNGARGQQNKNLLTHSCPLLVARRSRPTLTSISDCWPQKVREPMPGV